MSRTLKLFVSLLITLLTLGACGEKRPDVEWELTIDGDVNQTVTYTFQEIADMRRIKLADLLTQNPDDPDERVTWEGVSLFQLFQEPGGVEYSISHWAVITLADGTTHRFSLTDLRGGLIAIKDGEGNWLAETGLAPLRLIAPSKPSTQWLYGPVRITVEQ